MKPSILLLGFALSSCGSQAAVCDDSAVYSLFVSVVDENVAAVAGATVTYSVDGVDKGACDAFSNTTFGCGIEVAGDFEITASLAGYEDGAAAETVDPGVCHVVGRSTTVVLRPVVCDGDPVAAVFATVESATDTILTGVSVSSLAAGATDRVACIEDTSGWACASDDLSGSFTVFANADGLDEVSAQVDGVAADADLCHPVTATTTLTFP